MHSLNPQTDSSPPSRRSWRVKLQFSDHHSYHTIHATVRLLKSHVKRVMIHMTVANLDISPASRKVTHGPNSVTCRTELNTLNCLHTYKQSETHPPLESLYKVGFHTITPLALLGLSIYCHFSRELRVSIISGRIVDFGSIFYSSSLHRTNLFILKEGSGAK